MTLEANMAFGGAHAVYKHKTGTEMRFSVPSPVASRLSCTFNKSWALRGWHISRSGDNGILGHAGVAQW